MEHFYFTDKLVCYSNTQSACESDFLIFFYSTTKTNILKLCPQELTKMKITTSNNGVWTDFIALMTAASKSSFVISGNQKEYELVKKVSKQMFFLSYPVKVQAEPNVTTFHAMCFRHLRISCTNDRNAADNF